MHAYPSPAMARSVIYAHMVNVPITRKRLIVKTFINGFRFYPFSTLMVLKQHRLEKYCYIYMGDTY